MLRTLADPPAGLFLREVRAFLQALLGADHLWGNRVSITWAASGTQAVAHGLGKRPTGYVVEGKTAQFHVYDGAIPANPLPETTHVYLASTGAMTARVRFF